MKDKYIVKEVYSTNSLLQDYCDNHIFEFPKSKFISDEEYKIDRIKNIHGQKQREVLNILADEDIKEYVEYFIIFGSSTNIKCSIKSDLDICIKMKPLFTEKEYKNIIYDRIGLLTNYNCDIFFMDAVSSKFLESINKGVKFNV